MAAFVTKLNAAGDQLIYSTYLNGSRVDGATAIAVDAQGNAYVAGETDSRDFPVTGGALQQTLRPTSGSGFDSDGFITKLSPDGKKVIYSTYFGGGGTDLISALAIDAKGDVFITGATTRVDLPTTPGAALTKFSGSSSNATFMVGDAFVAEINPAGSALLYSTYLGGKQDDIAFSIALDTGGNAYVTGSTLSTDFPTTSGAFQTTYKGAGGENNFPCGDAFVNKLNSTGGLVYSTYLGGTMDDRGFVIAVDATGSAWVAGNTISKNFPLTPDAHQSAFGGLAQGQGLVLGDAFVARLNPAGNALLYSSYHGGSGNEAAIGLALTPDGGVLVSGTTSSRDIKVTAGVYEPRPYGGDPNLAPMLDGFLFKLSFPPPPPAVTISSIANEASLATGVVSPGMVVSISGSNLAAAASSADLTLSRLPFSLGQTRVLFDGLAAALISVSPTQIVAIAPYRLLAGTKTQVVVDWNGNQSAAVFLAVSASSPGLYANRVQNADGSANSADNPAVPNSTIIIAGTGEGQTAPAGVDGLIFTADTLPLPVLPVSATLGANDATVMATSGIAGEVADRFQIQVLVPPDGLDPGDYQFIVQVGDAKSQPIPVSIGRAADPAAARHGVRINAGQSVKHK